MQNSSQSWNIDLDSELEIQQKTSFTLWDDFFMALNVNHMPFLTNKAIKSIT